MKVTLHVHDATAAPHGRSGANWRHAVGATLLRVGATLLLLRISATCLRSGGAGSACGGAAGGDGDAQWRCQTGARRRRWRHGAGGGGAGQGLCNIKSYSCIVTAGNSYICTAPVFVI